MARSSAVTPGILTTHGPAQPHPTPAGAPAGQPRGWWSDTVGYQIYIRSFADAGGDGVGDLQGIISRLGYLEQLGVQTVWITPFYPSPMADAGYDVADPRDVEPAFGTLADFDQLLHEAHGRGLRVVIDLVPNHTSSEHPWFQAALAAAHGSPERDRYLFRDGRGPGAVEPPNNWASIFGGPAWTRVPDGQWYLHIFDTAQPDLNWRSPDVYADLRATLEFWLDRGVDGFRIDVAHGMAKPDGLPDAPPGGAAFDRRDFERAAALAAEVHEKSSGPEDLAGSDGGVVPIAHGGRDPRFDDDGVHEVHRFIRSVLDGYPGRMTIGEVWVDDDGRFADYIRPDELHQAFNFAILEAPFDAAAIREAIDSSMASTAGVGSLPVWTLANHDKIRPVTRFGGGAVGQDRARAALLVELALPGAVYLYNGEELGLPSIDVPDEALQDPTWVRSGFTERGRDNCRLPLPWAGETAPYGFSATRNTWLPVPTEYAALTVERQLEDSDSTLNLVRKALQLRATRPELRGEEIDWLAAPADCCAFQRRGGGLICILNAGDEPLPLPAGDLLLASTAVIDHELPPNAAAWLLPRD